MKEKQIVTTLYTLFANEKNDEITIPKVLATRTSKHSYSIEEEYIEAKELATYGAQFKSATLQKCLNHLESLSTPQNLQKVKKVLPVRGKAYMLLSFPILLVLAALKDRKNLSLYLQVAKQFYTYYLAENVFDPRFVLAHRDLTTHNILVGKKIYLIDPEVAAVAERLIDLAIVARFAAKELGAEYEILLNNMLKTESDKKKFLALSLYYSLQIMAISTIDCLPYKQGHKYISTYFQKTKKILALKEQSFAQSILRFSLNLISLGLRFFKPTHVISDSSILCYHNVGYENWNFTISPESLDAQLAWIKQQATIVPLQTLVEARKSRKPQIAITFDDGYKNMLTHAAPMIKNHAITPTLFILGSAKLANRTELDNSLPLLTTAEIKTLHKKGWEIGYHTNTHADLRTLSQNETIQELITSKTATEKRLRITIPYFAYPRGIYTKDSDTLLKDNSAYTAAFTVDGGPLSYSKNPTHITRVCFEGELELHQFQALMSFVGIRWYALFISVLKVKEQLMTKLKSKQYKPEPVVITQL